MERLLRTRIAARYPDDAVLGKESEISAGTVDRRWVLDPINGTSLFAHRVPTFNVLLAVEDAEGPLVAVAGYPMSDELLYAGRGWAAGTPLAGPAGPAGAGQRPRAAARRPGRDAQPAGVVRGAAAHPAPRAVPAAVDQGRRRPGHRARRRAGDRRRSPWPTRTSPSSLLVGEAGGRVTDLSGRDVLRGDGSVLATNGRLHDALLDLVAGLPHGRDFAASAGSPDPPGERTFCTESPGAGVLDDPMARGLRQAALLILAGAALGLIAGGIWAAVSDTGFARAAGISLIVVAGILGLTGGTALSCATTTETRAFMGQGPEQGDAGSGEGLTALGVFLFVSLPLLVVGLVLLVPDAPT